MIRLPHRIRAGRFAVVDRLEGFAVGFCALVRKGHEIWRQVTDDVEYGAIVRRCLPEIPRHSADLTIHCSDRQGRFLERQAFDGGLEPGRGDPALTGIAPRLPHQRRQAELLVPGNPALGRPVRHAGFVSDGA